MTDENFPSWWGPEGADPIQCRGPQEIQPGWFRHDGRYDVQLGRWIPDAPPAAVPPVAEPPAAPTDRLPPLARQRRAALFAIAAAERVAVAPSALRTELIAAIRAKRAGHDDRATIDASASASNASIGIASLR